MLVPPVSGLLYLRTTVQRLDKQTFVNDETFKRAFVRSNEADTHFFARQHDSGGRSDLWLKLLHIAISSPNLTLAQIFDALSYFSDHQAEITAYIERNHIPDTLIDPLIQIP